MENFSFCSPTEFVFGKDQEENAGALVKKHGGSKVLLHFGGGSVIKSGLLDRVKASLTKAGISFVELGGVKPNPRDTMVYEGIKICKEENIDFRAELAKEQEARYAAAAGENGKEEDGE